MKYLKLITATFLSAMLFVACSGNNAGNAGKEDSATTPTSSTTATTGDDASFSCMLDGKDFSGKGTDQIVNAATVHAPGIIYFSLSPNFSGDPGADMRAGGLGFEVPDKGTTVIRGVEDPRYSIGYNLPNELTNTYRCKEMTITINSSGTRVTGTFSGILIEPKTDREVPVTNGKFDIPYSTYSKN